MFEITTNPNLQLKKSYQISVNFHKDKFNILNFGELPESIKNSVATRQMEFLAGRHCAKLAMEKYFKLRSSVLINKDRSPVWPEGLIGSITHTDRFASVAVADKRFVLGIGIDSEKILSSETLRNIQDIFLNIEEKKLAEKNTMSLEKFSTLIFSAKESVFKCLYPLVQRFIDFNEVNIISINEEKKQYIFELQTDLSDTLKLGFTATGSFDINDEMIHTSLEILT